MFEFHTGALTLFKEHNLLKVHPLQKRGLLFLTKRLPRKRNQNWRTFDNFQKVIVCESQ